MASMSNRRVKAAIGGRVGSRLQRAHSGWLIFVAFGGLVLAIHVLERGAVERRPP